MPVYLLSSAFLGLGLSFLIHFLLFSLFLLLRLLHMQPDLAKTVLIAQIVSCGFDDNIIFVDGRVVNGLIVEGKKLVLAVGHY